LGGGGGRVDIGRGTAQGDEAGADEVSIFGDSVVTSRGFSIWLLTGVC
jgi:hypothetical protein